MGLNMFMGDLQKMMQILSMGTRSKTWLCLMVPAALPATDPEEMQVAHIQVEISDDEQDKPLEDDEDPRRDPYLTSGHTNFSEGETLIKCQSTSDPTSGCASIRTG